MPKGIPIPMSSFKMVVYRILRNSEFVFSDSEGKFSPNNEMIDPASLSGLSDSEAKKRAIVRFKGEIHKVGHTSKNGTDILDVPSLTINARKYRHEGFTMETVGGEIRLTVPEFERGDGSATEKPVVDVKSGAPAKALEFFQRRALAAVAAKVAADKAKAAAVAEAQN